MNKLQKFLSKLNPREKSAAEDLIARVISQNFFGLNVKKLKGENNLFRVRKGDIRIIYFHNDKTVSILEMERRNDNTYNF